MNLLSPSTLEKVTFLKKVLGGGARIEILCDLEDFDLRKQ